ncbi:hypothetical protein ACTL6U_13285 [Rhodovibrionaceae bacterium A322]
MRSFLSAPKDQTGAALSLLGWDETSGVKPELTAGKRLALILPLQGSGSCTISAQSGAQTQLSTKGRSFASNSPWSDSKSDRRIRQSLYLTGFLGKKTEIKPVTKSG